MSSSSAPGLPAPVAPPASGAFLRPAGGAPAALSLAPLADRLLQPVGSAARRTAPVRPEAATTA
ncbi:hypothetical protein POF50_026520 [Streptomyces sp. SL13]|uniref:Uncharacterized protein n=1 Tax=Streptantibioticus silvisoli TaxID=2705255 RepID=A0AA90H7W7_9ACTN|nr:hypothetical protein [Streptantibioticus silvisoli]MDI5972856.1 hypothetical protein [Streptantibioticus silvisoli]